MTLKLLNWNVRCENGALDKAVEFLSTCDADIMCLQEVPDALLQKLAFLPAYALVSARDGYHPQKGGRAPSFLVILSKLPMHAAKAIKLKRQPKRSLISRWLGYEECLEFHYADVALHHGIINKKEVSARILNMHLESVAGPKLRIARFAQILGSLGAGKKNVICGDLNILRAWYSWGWRFVLGSSWDELWVREYEVFEKMFERRGFANVFNGATTHEWSGSQLDYILVPNEIKVNSRTLFEETHGSDHKPMLVELGI